jgi:hypothetical protein
MKKGVADSSTSIEGENIIPRSWIVASELDVGGVITLIVAICSKGGFPSS